MLKKGLQFGYGLFFMTLAFVFLNATTLEAQVDRSGSYSYTVKDGQSFQLYVYSEGGEIYGRLKAEGSEKWEINLWSLQNGDYIDFYYEINVENPLFTQDTHIMTLSGDKKKPLSVFGKELKAKITSLKPADIWTWESDEPTFKIKDKAKSQTVEVKGEKKN